MAAKKQASAVAVPESIKAAAEKQGYRWVDRNVELSKWAKGVEVDGTFLGFKDGKKFSGREKASTLVRIRVEKQVQVYACPAILYQHLEDVAPGTDVIIICLGQTLRLKDRKELAWDFEVAIKA